MKIETRSLKLRPLKVTKEIDGNLILLDEFGRSVPLPAKFADFFFRVQEGDSIFQLIQNLHLLKLAQGTRKSIGQIKFIAKFLNYLSDNDLLLDSEAKQFCDSLRPDYVWPISLGCENIFSCEILSFKIQKKPKALNKIGALCILILLGIGLSLISISLDTVKNLIGLGVNFESNFQGRNITSSMLWAPLICFFMVTTIGKSARNVVQYFLSHITMGSRSVLNFRVEPLALYLEFRQNPHAGSISTSSRAELLYCIASFLSLSVLLLPLVINEFIISFFPARSLSFFIAVFTIQLLIMEVSPFRNNALTECLRNLFIFIDQKRDRVQGFQSHFVVGSVIWILTFGIFIVGPLISVAQFSIQLGSHFGKTGMVSQLILFFIEATILISLLDDVLNGALGRGASGFKRKVWLRSQKTPNSLSFFDQNDPENANAAALPLLRQLDQKSRVLLLQDAEVKELSMGQYVCHQGENDRALFVLLEGRLQVEKRNLNGQKRTIALLEPGAVFGEVAFFLGERRTADVVTFERSRLLQINHDKRIADFDRSRFRDLQLRIWFLQSLAASNSFKSLPSEAIDALLFSGDLQKFSGGAKVVSEGERGEFAYIIVQGRASVMQNFKLINRLKAGDLFGEIALFHPEVLRTATVIADTELHCMCIDSKKFWKLICHHLPLALEIENLIESRLMKDLIRES